MPCRYSRQTRKPEIKKYSAWNEGVKRELIAHAGAGKKISGIQGRQGCLITQRCPKHQRIAVAQHT
jgi:hypothetical protein